VLADEINRATPRTQSALLEQCRSGRSPWTWRQCPFPALYGVGHPKPDRAGGTFPLPEAQIDRFLMKVALGYPANRMRTPSCSRYEREDPLETLEPVIQASDLLAMQQQVKEVLVEESVRDYAVKVVRATRQHAAVELGVSPRVPWLCTRRPRRWPPCVAASSSSPTTSSTWLRRY